MGGSVSRILSGLLWTKKEIRILILGLVSHQQALAANVLRFLVGQRRQDDSALSIKGARLGLQMKSTDTWLTMVRLAKLSLQSQP